MHRLVFCAVAVSGAPLAFAHGIDAHSGLDWTLQPWVLGCLALAAAGYALGVRRLSSERRYTKWRGRLRGCAFTAGIATLFVALASPLDGLSEQLFCAHMTQHLLLMLVAPPLLVWGRPVVTWLWAFPAGRRRAIGRAWQRIFALRAGVQLFSRPLPAWLAGTCALWLWHMPVPYAWALEHPVVHVVEHASFLLTAMAFWAVTLDRSRHMAARGGMAFLFVATFAMQSGMLGALLTFSGQPLYESHLHTAPLWGLTPLQDQQLAGLIMWIPSSVVHLLTLCVLFVLWLNAAERAALLDDTQHLSWRPRPR